MGLVVARDPDLHDIVLESETKTEPVYLPEHAFKPGRYYWAWRDGEQVSGVFTFDITSDSVVLEIPPVQAWLQRFPDSHPRLYIRPEQVGDLRQRRHDAKASLWRQLKKVADDLLDEPHETEEPPFLPDRQRDYKAWFGVWYRTMWGSRRFVRGASTLGLAYLASGDTTYARAACRRMDSIARWDPEGSSYLGHNDEAHMSVIWHGPSACDWVWDHFTDEELEHVINQYRRRGQITYDHMRNRGYYGVTRFDSHAGREIVFLAHIALVFHDHIPEAETWLAWLRPILCGVWPIWAEDDGGWAEGLSYGLAYVDIMTMFASALKHGAGIDLYRRPFWRNHTIWRQYCMPPYAEWIGFGDHTERWAATWHNNANLVDLIDREADAHAMGDYVTAFRAEAEKSETPPEREMPGVSPQLYLIPDTDDSGETGVRDASVPPLRVFPAVGWAAIRTHLYDSSRDIAFLFRSSPYGAVSHSHASNNDFIIHVGGKVMAMPSGYYAGYGSDHHAHWVWHTKSHNCITLSDASQLMRSHASQGLLDHVFKNEALVYFRGVADASYRDRADRCRRHVFFIRKHQCFLLVDEFTAKPDVISALQWNIHSWYRFTIDDTGRTFTVQNDARVLVGHVMHHQNGYFSSTEGWEPPPSSAKASDQWRQQYHLRYTPSGFEDKRNLGVILCPGHDTLTPASVITEGTSAVEIARIGDDLVMVNQSTEMAYENIVSDALVMIVIDGVRYETRDTGVDIV